MCECVCVRVCICVFRLVFLDKVLCFISIKIIIIITAIVLSTVISSKHITLKVKRSANVIILYESYDTDIVTRQKALFF